VVDTVATEGGNSREKNYEMSTVLRVRLLYVGTSVS
jgi:hypothetical protein